MNVVYRRESRQNVPPPKKNYKSQKHSTQITKLMYVRGHSKETTETAAALEGGFLLGWERENIQRHLQESRAERKRIGHIQGFLRERLGGTGIC